MQTPAHEHTPTWRDLADEGAALEILHFEDRVRDLERDHALAREMLSLSLGQLESTRRRLRETQAELRDERRKRIRAERARRAATRAAEQLRALVLDATRQIDVLHRQNGRAA